MVWFRRILLTLLITFLLLVAGGIVIVVVYGDRMKEFVMDTARSNITTQMGVSDDVRVSFWKDFPRVSVELRDVWVQDSFRTDTLLKAQSVFVQLDIIKVLTDRLVIQGIRVTNGYARIRQNAKGDWNYMVWEESEKEAAATDLSIDLLALEEMDVRFVSKWSSFAIDLRAERATMKGHFTDDAQDLELSIQGLLRTLSTSDVLRVEGLAIDLSGMLGIQDKGRTVSIEMGNAELAGNEVVWSMLWQQKDQGSHIRLSLEGEGVAPEELLPHIWPNMPETVRNLAIQGKSDITLELKGPLSPKVGPALNATWKLMDGSILFRALQVTDLNFQAEVSIPDLKRSQDTKVIFNSFSLRTPKGEVKGDGMLNNFVKPYLTIRTEGHSHLEEILEVVGDSVGVKGEGTISWDVIFEGPLGENFKTTKAELRQMQWSGTAQFADVELNMNNGIPPIADFHGQVVMEGADTRITEFSGQLGHLVFDGQLAMKDLREVLSDPQHPLTLTGDVTVETMDVAKLPSEWTMMTAEKQVAKTGSSRPISLDATVEVGKVVFKGFTAEKLKGHLTIIDRKLEARDLRFNALGGTVAADLKYTPTADGALIYVDADMRSIDISRLLREWDDFGQTTVTSKHLKGTADAELQVQIPLDANDDLIRKGVLVECDLRVSGGELIAFEPLNALSRFIEVEELKHVRFDTIVNHFSMRNERLIIPYMQVRSSILNVDVYGEHGLNQELDYHVNLLLNDILRRKAKKKQFFDGHEIIDEKGKTRLYLWIRGRPGDITVGFDKKEVRLKVKDELKKEGSSIKQLFQDEFRGKGATTRQDQDAPVQFRLEDKTTAPATEDKTKDEKPAKKRKGLFSKEDDETEGGFELEPQ